MSYRSLTGALDADHAKTILGGLAGPSGIERLRLEIPLVNIPLGGVTRHEVARSEARKIAALNSLVSLVLPSDSHSGPAAEDDGKSEKDGRREFHGNSWVVVCCEETGSGEFIAWRGGFLYIFCLGVSVEAETSTCEQGNPGSRSFNFGVS